MSKKYDVYGLGNALVDIQYRVDPVFFETMAISKGQMTLIDDTRQQALIEALGGKELARSSGGSAANTMISLVNCGGAGYYACKVAHDKDGDFYLNDLKAAGVAFSPANRDHGTTGKCLVMITPDADRTMNTFLGITNTFGVSQIEESVIADSHYIYIEGYLVTSDTGFQAAQAAQKFARAHGTKVALTLSDAFVIDIFKSRMDLLVQDGVDLLFCNEDEAKMFTGKNTTDAACDALAQCVGGFAVTCGAQGAKVGNAEQMQHIPGFKVNAVDTNGAGDAFAGAYLFGLTHGFAPEKAAKLAAYVSSRVVSQYGPRFDQKLSSDHIENILAL